MMPSGGRPLGTLDFWKCGSVAVASAAAVATTSAVAAASAAATTEAAAASTAAAVSAAASASAATGALFARLGFVHRQRAAALFLAVQRGDRRLGFLIG